MGNGYGEVRDAVEKVHGPVDRIDDPLVGGCLVTADSLLSVNGVLGEGGQDALLNQGLGASVEFQLDIVGFGGINGELTLEVAADHRAGFKRSSARGRQYQIVHL